MKNLLMFCVFLFALYDIRKKKCPKWVMALKNFEVKINCQIWINKPFDGVKNGLYIYFESIK